MPALLRYATKKILIGIPVVLSVSLFIFLLMQAMPGDPIEMISGEKVTQQRLEELKRSWGLDQPIYIQYFYWLSHLFTGDFGISYRTKLPASLLIWSRIPYTLQLTLTALILSYVLGIPMGVMAALKRGTFIDSITIGTATFFYSMPTYWLGLMLMLTFGLNLKWFPISGASSFESMILPTITLTLPYVAMSARIVRTEMLEVLTEDYIRTAWAKGLPSRKVILTHALRNALIPLTVMFFLDLPWIIGGAVIVETVFAWPGMGTLLYQSIVKQDYPVVQAIVLIIAILTVVCNILGDIISAALDPRIRVEKGE
jgi:ABC-type dipeptide/oligopeptide/nickel transport system permease component